MSRNWEDFSKVGTAFGALTVPGSGVMMYRMVTDIITTLKSDNFFPILQNSPYSVALNAGLGTLGALGWLFYMLPTELTMSHEHYPEMQRQFTSVYETLKEQVGDVKAAFDNEDGRKEALLNLILTFLKLLGDFILIGLAIYLMYQLNKVSVIQIFGETAYGQVLAHLVAVTDMVGELPIFLTHTLFNYEHLRKGYVDIDKNKNGKWSFLKKIATFFVALICNGLLHFYEALFANSPDATISITTRIKELLQAESWPYLAAAGALSVKDGLIEANHAGEDDIKAGFKAYMSSFLYAVPNWIVANAIADAFGLSLTYKILLASGGLVLTTAEGIAGGPTHIYVDRPYEYAGSKCTKRRGGKATATGDPFADKDADKAVTLYLDDEAPKNPAKAPEADEDEDLLEDVEFIKKKKSCCGFFSGWFKETPTKTTSQRLERTK